MESQTDRNMGLNAAAIMRLLNSKSMRKSTRDPRSPTASKFQRPMRRLKGPSASCMRISESGLRLLRVVNCMCTGPLAAFTAARASTGETLST